MICSTRRQFGGRSARPRHLTSRGFTLIETVIVVAIALVLGAIAIPFIQSSTRYFSLRAAASSLSGAIQSTRYQAIFHGCKYQIAFRAATYDYQISSEAPAAGATTCAGAFTNVGGPIPLAGARTGVTLNADVTLQFSPGGIVQPVAGNMAAITLTQPGVTTAETIQVSTYGKVLVTP